MSEEMGGGYTLDDRKRFFLKLKRKEDKKRCLLLKLIIKLYVQ